MPETNTEYVPPPADSPVVNAMRAVDTLRQHHHSLPAAPMLAALKVGANVAGAGLIVNEVTLARQRITESIETDLTSWVSDGDDLLASAVRVEHTVAEIVNFALERFWMGCFSGAQLVGGEEEPSESARHGLDSQSRTTVQRSLRGVLLPFARETLYEQTAQRFDGEERIYPPSTFSSAEQTYAWAVFLRSIIPLSAFSYWTGGSGWGYAESGLQERTYELNRFFALTAGDFELCSCGDVGERNEGTDVNGTWVCGSCADDTSACSSCSETCWTEDMYRDPDDDMICGSCHEEAVFECDECGTESWRSRDVCQGCGRSGPDGGGDDCGGSSGDYGPLHVNYYSYKPEARFHYMEQGTLRTSWNPDTSDGDRIFMGVELETNCPGGRSSRSDGGAAIFDADIMREHGFIYAKSDCTVSGPEIVSHPATLDAHRFLWETFPFRPLAVQHGWTGWRGGNAGIHIHVARTAFNGTSHIARFQMFFGGWRDEMITFCGRNDAAYGHHGSAMQGRAISYAKRERYPARGSAINHEPRHTIEVRMFRSSLRPTTLAAYLELVHALVTYTGIKRSSDILSDNAADFFTFLTWMNDNGNYTNAVNRIAERSN